MVNGKTPLLLTFIATGLFVAIVFMIQPYSADSSGRAYAKPARRFIQAALRQDSAKLASLSITNVPVAWALNAARRDRESLALWGERTEGLTGPRAGDTTEVMVYPADGERCSKAPMLFRFVGSGNEAKVLSVSSSCLGPDRDRD